MKNMSKEPVPWKGASHEQVLKKLAPQVIKYVDWYCENGIYLPEEYAKDPATWAQVLRYIEVVFVAIKEGTEPKDDQEVALRDRGLDYFYKYFQHLFR